MGEKVLIKNWMSYIYTQSTLTVPIKSKLPSSQEMSIVSRETRLERNEMSLERNKTSLVSLECTGSTNTSQSSVFETCFL